MFALLTRLASGAPDSLGLQASISQCLVLLKITNTSARLKQTPLVLLSLNILFLKQDHVSIGEAAVTGDWKVLLAFGILGTQDQES